ncbi:PREDICTED: olfactory receptor 8D1-like [Nanorana parkeri]|uniref:olfactory receptor 8D1-like n=1 Tax=Nanorana parkeri TaxID=125878 RepID=UPI000854F25C|nr:PREDICTED: olfactory receptor 8D1-like [Nanorana parkeri]
MNLTFFTSPDYFVIKGISVAPELQFPIFLLVLLIYVMTLGGNMTILLLVSIHHHLHTPMYFFLSNLSVVDITSATVTLHKILFTFITGNRRMAFIPCVAQMYVFISLVCVELMLLTTMSYDRYMAICNPLHYHLTMNQVVCALLAMFCWVLSFLEIIPHLLVISSFTCFTSNEINHFFCDIMLLVKLSCSNTSIINLLIFTYALVLSTCPLLLTIVPYGFILHAVMRITSSSGRRKAFYTCSSHLTVVFLLYLTLAIQYLRPNSIDNLNFNKLFSMLNTAAVPILNPLIYSLKNEDVKSALKQGFKSAAESMRVSSGGGEGGWTWQGGGAHGSASDVMEERAGMAS